MFIIARLTLPTTFAYRGSSKNFHMIWRFTNFSTRFEGDLYENMFDLKD
jgi:hypothetical protein